MRNKSIEKNNSETLKSFNIFYYFRTYTLEVQNQVQSAL
jgi:hypothetical protein